MDLWGNRLSTLPAGIFRRLGSLRDLNLFHNELTSLPPGIFSGLSRLERVNFRLEPGSIFATARWRLELAQ